MRIDWRISIHAPREGSDSTRVAPRVRPDNFNPRSPRGERLQKVLDSLSTIGISIHAPREGSDLYLLSGVSPILHFNPRSPRGERPAKYRYKVALHGDFNPRSPRGERPNTRRGGGQGEHFNPRSPRGERRRRHGHINDHAQISIHAPREGSDAGRRHTSLRPCAFQSTLPARGATVSC